MKKVLVTGGCGFIGSNFIKYFLHSRDDINIVNIDKLTYCGNINNISELNASPRHEFIQGDICDAELMRDVSKGSDTIINFAAETHVDRSIEDSENFLKTNVLGVQNLLEVVRLQHVKKFIQVSTDEVYGSVSEGASDEYASLLPNSPYAASKAAADLLIRSFVKTFNIPAIITRCSNNYGPFQYPEKVIPLFITNLIENEKVPLYAKGDNVREWIHVEDHCRAIAYVWENGAIGEIYNIGSDCEVSNLTLTRKIISYFKKDDSWINSVPDRLGHDFRYRLNSTKLKSLGFELKHSFDSALIETIKWYENNKTWWKPLKENKYTRKK